MLSTPLHCYVGALVGTRRRLFGRYEIVQRVAWCLAHTPAEAEIQLLTDLKGVWAGWQITITVEEMPASLLHLYATRILLSQPETRPTGY